MLRHYPTRRSVGYYGAVRLRDGRFVFQRETTKFNAETCFEFLRQLRRQSGAERRQVVVILDNAAYHHARLHKQWRLQHQDRFRLEFLPPYSPELDPVEGLWDQVQDVTCNQRQASPDALKQTLTAALRPFGQSRANALSLMHHWLRAQANATP